MAADFMRGLRWRAALTIVGAGFVIATFLASGARGYIIRVDFTYVPDAIGADVVVDGEPVDTLKILRRQPINGIRVSKGEHILVIRSEDCVGNPLTVTPIRGEKTISVFHHLAEGCGQRRICRLVGVSRDAVSRLTRIAGTHAKALHDELVSGVQVKEAQADEKWSFVGKKRESLQR